MTRPDGTEKWVWRGRLTREMVEDTHLSGTYLDGGARLCAESQGVTLVEHISTDLHPYRCAPGGGRMVAEPCGPEDADHYLAGVKWWAR